MINVVTDKNRVGLSDNFKTDCAPISSASVVEPLFTSPICARETEGVERSNLFTQNKPRGFIG